MILHLVDDEKFIDATIEHFEKALPNVHIYMILGSKTELKYIKNKNKILFYQELNIDKEKYILQEGIKSIFIHYLSNIKVDFVYDLKREMNVKLIWFFWGADGYELGKLGYKLYDNKTVEALINSKKYSSILKILNRRFKIFNKVIFFITDLTFKRQRKIKLIKRLDYIVPVIIEDYNLLKSKYSIKAEAIEWNYLSIEQMLPFGIDNKVVSSNNILLGNSAHPSNNHIEVIDRLALFNLNDKKVIVPLSYGNPKYRDLVINHGIKKLGDSFVPLTGFLPLNEYNKIIESCGFVIMNQYRQQAMGNIIVALYMGAKLFLNKNSTMSEYFSRLNVKYYSLDEMFENNDFNVPLEAVYKEYNQKKIYTNWNSTVIDDKTQQLISKVVYS